MGYTSLYPNCWSRTSLSTDNGQTWQPSRTLFANPHGWYCYTAIEVVGEQVLLGHCAGDRRQNNGLAETQTTRVLVERLYGAKDVPRSPQLEVLRRRNGSRIC